MNYERLNRLSEMVTQKKGKKPTIVLENLKRLFVTDKIDINVNVENTNWEIAGEMEKYITSLAKNDSITMEEKILEIYLKFCNDYVYDDNVLSYLKIKDQDVFALPEFYGKEPSEEWKENRKTHNRRVCFEISRELAKALIELTEKSGRADEYDVCILWNKDLVHYMVGLTSDDYSMILDLDNFEKIKDLTRVKVDLSVDGIEILEDKENKFRKVLDKHNETKTKTSTEQIKRHGKAENTETKTIESKDREFLETALKIIKDEYNLDYAGIFEYMKEIVDTRLGSESRKKVWKRIKNENGEEIYTRCIIATIGNQEYLIDVTVNNFAEMLSPISAEDYKNLGIIKSLHRPFDEKYSGR